MHEKKGLAKEGSIVILGYAHDEEVDRILTAAKDFDIYEQYKTYCDEMGGSTEIGDWTDSISGFTDWLLKHGFVVKLETDVIHVMSWATDYPADHGFYEIRTLTPLD